MDQLRAKLTSTIGLKVLMAVSGLAMVGFLIAHLSGNLLVFMGPEVLNEYARTLRDFLPILWFLRLGLIASVVAHIVSAVILTKRAKQARPVPYVQRSFIKTTSAQKSMAYSGLLVLCFFIFHLAHLTLRMTHPEFVGLGDYDVYQMLIISFSSPILSIFYCISIFALMMHLNHGIQSLFQTLGLYTRELKSSLNKASVTFSIVLGCGFVSIPIAILTGLVS